MVAGDFFAARALQNLIVGEVYGRQVVGVRVCGIPKRDMRTAESALNQDNPSSGKRKVKTESTNTPAPVMSSTTPSSKRIKLEDSECDTLVTIPPVTVAGAREALAGLRVMREFQEWTRGVLLRAGQDVRRVDAGLASLAAAEDAVRRQIGAHVAHK